MKAKHPSSETLVTAYNAVTVRAVRAIEFEKREEQRVRDEALRLREEQRRDRNEQLQKLAKVNPREAGRMIVARIRQMRDGGLPADKDDLDDLRALRQSKARAKVDSGPSRRVDSSRGPRHSGTTPMKPSQQQSTPCKR